MIKRMISKLVKGGKVIGTVPIEGGKMKKFLVLSLMIGLVLVGELSAADVEVKLTTTDGSTKFEVQDSGAVGVAGIDSNGNIYPGNGTNYNSSRYIYDDSTNYATRFSSNVYIEQGALRDRSVESADLIVTSTCTRITTTYDTSSNVFSDLPGAYGSLTITAVPATVIINFTASGYRTDAGWTKAAYQILVGATVVGFGESGSATDNQVINVGVTGGLRITSAETYIVKVQVRSGDTGGAWGTYRTTDASFNAFYFGSN